MIIRIYILLIWLAISSAGLSQFCLPEGITFSSQSQLDLFQSNYLGCIEIEGNVAVIGDDIANLDGLNVLTTIRGNLDIGYWYQNNPHLSTIQYITLGF